MKCPFCAEEIKNEAIKCPYCKEFLKKASGNCIKSPAVQETITPEEYKNFLELAPSDILKQVADGLLISIKNIPDDSPHLEVFYAMLSMLSYELQLREIEPLWRKAKRFTARNSAIVKEFVVGNSDTIKEVSKIAACIGAGALIAGPVGAMCGLMAATSQENEKNKK